MDWNLLLSGLIGVVTGGSVSWLFKVREDKAGSKADVIDKSADAMKKLLEITEHQSIAFEEILKKKDELIAQQVTLIDDYKSALDDANRKIRGFDYKVAENERKISGMQKMLDAQLRGKLIADNSACYNNPCAERMTAKDLLTNNK